MSEQRLLHIETTMAYQDDLLNTLNRIVAEQALTIDALGKTVRQLAEQMQQVSDLLVTRDAVDERPPHY